MFSSKKKKQSLLLSLSNTKTQRVYFFINVSTKNYEQIWDILPRNRNRKRCQWKFENITVS